MGEQRGRSDADGVPVGGGHRLRELVGEPADKLHTGRSRNDQVATDVRLWLRGEIDAIGALLVQMQRALLGVAAVLAATGQPARFRPA